ncbi:hypothetical protein, partial [Sphingomonas sp. RS2018]
LVAAIALVIVTIVTRAIPISSADHSNAVFSSLIVISLAVSFVIYRIYRKELLRMHQPNRKFPLIMAFITSALLIQLSLRVSQL